MNCNNLLKSLIAIFIFSLLAACSKEPKETKKDLEYYKSHYEEVEPTLAKCEENKSKLTAIQEANCEEAAQAKMFHRPARSKKEYKGFKGGTLD